MAPSLLLGIVCRAFNNFSHDLIRLNIYTIRRVLAIDLPSTSPSVIIFYSLLFNRLPILLWRLYHSYSLLTILMYTLVGGIVS